MINYVIYKGESLPIIRVVIDEQLTIVDNNWTVEAIIVDKDKNILRKKMFDLVDNDFRGSFERDEINTLPIGKYDIVIITSNHIDGFRDVTYRTLYIKEAKIDVDKVAYTYKEPTMKELQESLTDKGNGILSNDPKSIENTNDEIIKNNRVINGFSKRNKNDKTKLHINDLYNENKNTFYHDDYFIGIKNTDKKD